MQNSKLLIFLGCLAAVVLLGAGFGVWIAAPQSSSHPGSVPRIARLLMETRDGKLCPKAGGGPFTGIMYEQTSDKRLISEVPLKEGVVHGMARGWHDNGQLEVEEPFENGFSHGLRTRWHPNGKKRSEATIVHGELHGAFTEWHENGQIAVRMELVHGKGEGACEAWHPDGRPKSKVTLKNGIPVHTEYFSNTVP